MKLKLAVLTFFLIVPVLTYGQGSGSSKSTKSSSGNTAKKSNFAINRSISGTITSISLSSISILNSSGKTNAFVIKRNTKFIGGRPGKGDRVKVTFLASNKQAVSIRRS